MKKYEYGKGDREMKWVSLTGVDWSKLLGGILWVMKTTCNLRQIMDDGIASEGNVDARLGARRPGQGLMCEYLP